MNPTLASTWAERVQHRPDAVALIEAATGRAWTRKDLDKAAEGWAAEHRAAVEGATVMFSELNGARWWVVFLGLLKVNAIVAPLDPGDPIDAQRRAATAIGAAALWTSGRMEIFDAKQRPTRDGRRLIKLTSGTTGMPRAVVFKDAQMLADGKQVCDGMSIGGSDINFGLIPFGHSYGLGNLVVPLIAQGTVIVCGSAALPQAIATEIAQHRATIFPAVPALLRALVDADIDPQQLASVRTVISAGAQLPPEIATRFHARFGRKIHSFYGSTETGGITYDATGDAALTGRSVGRPLPGVRLQFGRGRKVAVTSAAVYTIENRQRIAGVGLYRTADLAELDRNGELVLIGRAGRTVKIAGRRLNLAEVELALRKIAGVREAFAMLHPQRADAIAAVVAAERPSAELREALRVALAAWKIPRKLISVAAFPLTARGKTDTRALQRLLSE